MAVVPVIESGDILQSGSNTGVSNPPVGYQAYVSGDLMIMFLHLDDDDGHG